HHRDTKTASRRTTHSLPARFEPFTPDLRPTVWISTSIIVERTNKCAPILSVRRLPIVTPRRTNYVISVSEQFLTPHNVLERHTSRISQHVVKHHERGRSSKSGFAVKMRPRVLRKRANGDNESIDCLIGRSRMVGNGDPYITGARGPHEIAFDAGFFYNHLLRDGRFSIALFDGVTWPNGNFAPRTKRLHPYSFGLFNFSLTAADIRPIACCEPANREAVGKYVCFLP